MKTKDEPTIIARWAARVPRMTAGELQEALISAQSLEAVYYKDPAYGKLRRLIEAEITSRAAAGRARYGYKKG